MAALEPFCLQRTVGQLGMVIRLLLPPEPVLASRINPGQSLCSGMLISKASCPSHGEVTLARASRFWLLLGAIGTGVDRALGPVCAVGSVALVGFRVCRAQAGGAGDCAGGRLAAGTAHVAHPVARWAGRGGVHRFSPAALALSPGGGAGRLGRVGRGPLATGLDPGGTPFQSSGRCS